MEKWVMPSQPKIDVGPRSLTGLMFHSQFLLVRESWTLKGGHYC